MRRAGSVLRLSALVSVFVVVLLTGFGERSIMAEDSTPVGFRLATFSADVTPPLGHSLLGGATTPPPAHVIDDPLLARGFVLIGGEKPVVVVSIDWCEIRNDA